MRVEDMTKHERELLLYLESRCVDNSGRIDHRQVNKEDIDKLKEWEESGFIAYGRLPTETFMDKLGVIPNWSTFVVLSATAWNMAHRERGNRAKRARGTFLIELRKCDPSDVQKAAIKAYEETCS